SRQGRPAVCLGRRGRFGAGRSGRPGARRASGEQRIGLYFRAAEMRPRPMIRMGEYDMGRMTTILLAAAAMAVSGCASAQGAGAAGGQPTTVRTPEGALMQVDADLAYKPGELTQQQLTSSTRELFAQSSMKVFRRFPRDKTADMIEFYTEALALRSLNPIQLTSTQQMILTGVGSGQIKLSAGQQGDRLYNLEGGPTGGTGIRFFQLTYPDRQVVLDRFAAAGLPAPEFRAQPDGTQAAFANDPGGFPVLVVIKPGAKDRSDDGVGVGIGVSDLAKSRAFYREFVGLDELPPIENAALGRTVYPYRNGETTLYLYEP